MTVPNQAAPAGSPSAKPGSGQPGAPIDLAVLQQQLSQLQTQVTEAHNQIKVLSKYRSGMDQILRDAPDAVEFDPATGQVRWKESAPSRPSAPAGAPGPHPFADLIEDPTQVNTWLNGEVNRLLASQGYVTAQQAQQLANQAYQSARGDFLVLRTIDRLLGNEKYKDLSLYDSPLSKKTMEILQGKGARPVQGEGVVVDGWDKWQYPAVGSLQEAADLARVALWEEQQAGQSAVAAAQANQGAAGLAQPGGGVPGAGTPGDDSWKKAADEGNLIDQMRNDTARQALQQGIVK